MEKLSRCAIQTKCGTIYFLYDLIPILFLSSIKLLVVLIIVAQYESRINWPLGFVSSFFFYRSIIILFHHLEYIRYSAGDESSRIIKKRNNKESNQE